VINHERAGSRRHADHADVIWLPTSPGTSVELMRTSFRNQTFPRHTHEYFTLGVMLRGVGTLWYRGITRTAHRGDVVVIPPGEVHTGGMGQGSGLLSYLAVHVPAETFARCAEANDLSGGIPDFASPVARDEGVRSALCRLDRAIRPRDGGTDTSEDAVDALTTAIDLMVRRHSDAAPALAARESMPEPTLVRVIRNLIEDCYADRGQTSLQALARHVGVSPFHLVRVFTQTTGLSPHRYIVQTRVRRAGHLLAEGTPPSFVAAMTGFVDQSHLTAQFKRYVGTTPAAYQRCLSGRLPRVATAVR
jgi:AraC-like DNA-binding protein/quercetin dioxygenase-like cupin family protein